ncbi:MAG: cysteine desulfurase [Ignavibacteria bacterium]|nr:cysteine desulfurase [Ignavibacteria bacterium]
MQTSDEQIIYLDNNATTRVDPRVVESMLPFFTEEYANPASNHLFGVRVNQAVRAAREKVAELLNCSTGELVFTSGATEAINLAIKGFVRKNRDKGKHIITVQTEHKAVLDVCASLETEGFETTYLPVDSGGLINLEDLKNAFRPDTILVSVMYVNNETGVIQPIEEIARITHEHAAIFMTDATQAVGKIPVDVNKMGIDMLTFSGHKFYGPKGIGGLFFRGRRPNKVKLATIQHGGGHESGLRSGTLNVPGIIGLGKACEIAMTEMEADAARIKTLRDELEQELIKSLNCKVNGNTEHRIYNTSNICIPGIDADALIIGLKNIIISTGSACSSNSVESSHVLRAIGLSSSELLSNIRISLSKTIKFHELAVSLRQITLKSQHLRILAQ